MSKTGFKVEMWDIDKPKAYDTNPRQIGVDSVVKTAMSIKKYGWRQPIVVDEKNIIIAGHTRLMAGQYLKQKEVPVHVAEGLSEEEKQGYRIADNRTGLESQWDFPLLTEEFKKLNEADYDLKLTGFDKKEIDELLNFEITDPFKNYEEGEKGNLEKKFLVPPFSVLDTRQGYWQDRKEYWNNLIGDIGQSRENTLVKEKSIMENIGSVSILDAVLAELICLWFGKKDFHAFDCFAGDSVFGFVAGSSGLTFTGIELRHEQAEINNKRVKDANLSAKYICDDGKNMDKYIKDESVDLFFSCPPYADLEVYSDLPDDLSNMSHEDFFHVYKECLTKSYSKLKNNRFAVITTSEVRSKKGNYISLVPKTIDIMVNAGYKFWNEMILVNSAGTLPLRATKAMQANRKIGRMHQNVLVFYKGNSKEIKNEFGDIIHNSEGNDEWTPEEL